MHFRVKVRLFPQIFGGFLGSESNLQAAPPLASEVSHSMSRSLTLVTITSAHAGTVNGAGRNRASLQGRSDLFALLAGVSGGEDFRIIKAGIRGCYASFNKAD